MVRKKNSPRKENEERRTVDDEFGKKEAIIKLRAAPATESATKFENVWKFHGTSNPTREEASGEIQCPQRIKYGAT